MKKYNLLIYNVFALFFLDIAFKLFVFKEIFELSTIYMLIEDITIATIITLVESLLPKLGNKIISIIITLCITIIIVSQFIYFKYYDAIFSIYSLFHGAQVLGFIDSIMEVIFENILAIIVLLIPIILFFIFFKKINFERKNYKFCILLITFGIMLHLIVLLLLNISNKSKTYSSYSLYYDTHVPKLTVKDFGVITEMRLDLKRTLFGFTEKITIENEETEQVIEDEKK